MNKNYKLGSISPKVKSAIHASPDEKRMNKMLSNSSSDFVSNQSLIIPFSKNYSITSEIGKGAFGRIYEVSRKSSPSSTFAAKIVSRSDSTTDNANDCSSLEKEAQILCALSSEEGFPKIESYQTDSENEILIMSLLGENLSTLKKKCGDKFSLKTIVFLALQILPRLEALHNRGVLHRDIKPENIVMGNHEEAGKAFLIDFGLSESYLDSKNKHVPFSRNQKIGGTLYYLSTFGHLGIQASRRDDLISLGYTLIYLFKGELPWAKLPGKLQEKIHRMFQMKSTMSMEILCQGLPNEFCEYMKCVCSLPFYQKPNYEYLEGLFKKIIEDKGIQEDGYFDWTRREDNIGKGPKALQVGLDKYIKKLEESESSLDL